MDWYRPTEQLPSLEEPARAKLAPMDAMRLDGTWTTPVCHRSIASRRGSQWRWAHRLWGTRRRGKGLHPSLRRAAGRRTTREILWTAGQTWKARSAGEHQSATGEEVRRGGRPEKFSVLIDFSLFRSRVQVKFTFKERSEIRYVDVYR